jgi:hypothetical protein
VGVQALRAEVKGLEEERRHSSRMGDLQSKTAVVVCASVCVYVCVCVHACVFVC